MMGGRGNFLKFSSRTREMHRLEQMARKKQNDIRWSNVWVIAGWVLKNGSAYPDYWKLVIRCILRALDCSV